ncbi:hypothetical protein BDF20DRAFT_984326 [Mycotypha africana]|uniref:uncharacterized protein n=1 Tax=Mycotypha africana TaxID=64632 RepID=UPI002301B7A7|nr:uncharacterized protein BDF20DRAFT_984326 [Mycotypha africana]KAI8991704.1 hypothetical protein BDF20DRAFT_984326 [Mycotypha africana]
MAITVQTFQPYSTVNQKWLIRTTCSDNPVEETLGNESGYKRHCLEKLCRHYVQILDLEKHRNKFDLNCTLKKEANFIQLDLPNKFLMVYSGSFHWRLRGKQILQNNPLHLACICATTLERVNYHQWPCAKIRTDAIPKFAFQRRISNVQSPLLGRQHLYLNVTFCSVHKVEDADKASKANATKD